MLTTHACRVVTSKLQGPHESNLEHHKSQAFVLSGHKHRASYEMDKNDPDESKSDDKSDESKSDHKSDESKSDHKSDESTETDGEKGGGHRPGRSECCRFLCFARAIKGQMAMCQNQCKYQSICKH